MNDSHMIGFRVFHDRDEDILKWWSNIPAGERSHVLRTLIRAYLNGEIMVKPLAEDATAFSTSVQLAQVQADTRWLRDTLLDMPAYLEHLLGNIKLPYVVAAPQAQEGMPSQGDLADGEADLRTTNIRKVQW